MLTLSYFALILLLCNLICSKGNKCYGIALEGGGTKGIYQAGAYKALTYNLPTDQIYYDVISGFFI